ncbi:MAG: hypothetical protein ACU0C9_07510 [Paracoccaceae bacterium]
MEIISGIKAASDALKLAKELRSIDGQVDQADLKLRLIELTDKLVLAKEALSDAKQNECDLRAQIQALENAGQFEDENGLLFKLDENGIRVGKPFCNQCFVKERKHFRLRYIQPGGNNEPLHVCDNCEKAYAS